MAEAFKFVHASDFHLDQPIEGLAELPNHLKSALAKAPYESARKVFDTAIAERVDFVLLAGDILELSNAGPRAMAFLLGQFRRLGEHGIETYWCSGSVDPIDRWPVNIEMPGHVRTFSTSVLEDVTHRRDGKAIANIYGIGYDSERKSAAEFVTDSDDVFPIALAYGEFDENSMPHDRIRYWALGGRHKSAKQEKPGSVVVWPGTTLGRKPKESGPCGCNLVRVDSHGKLRLQSLETDVVRWLPQKVAIKEGVPETELKNMIGERALKIASDFSSHVLLVSWHLTTTGDFNPRLRHREFRTRMLEWLRDEFGRGESGIWSTQFTVDPPTRIPTSWYEEDTILGEYLRAVGRYQSDESLNISLHEYIPDTGENPELSGMDRVSGQQREKTLRQTALAGIEYLGADRELVESADETTMQRQAGG